MTLIIARAQKVETHPDDGLGHISVVTICDKLCLSGKLDDGSHRYREGELIGYCAVNSVIPLKFLEFQGFYWDAEKGRGLLKGSKRNRVGPVQRGSVLSEGVLFPVAAESGKQNIFYYGAGLEQLVMEGDDLSDLIGITEYTGS